MNGSLINFHWKKSYDPLLLKNVGFHLNLHLISCYVRSNFPDHTFSENLFRFLATKNFYRLDVHLDDNVMAFLQKYQKSKRLSAWNSNSIVVRGETISSGEKSRVYLNLI